jgi:hypothetical protein
MGWELQAGHRHASNTGRSYDGQRNQLLATVLEMP